MRLLHIDTSILGPHSVSRQLSAEIVAKLAASTPGIAVTYRDLAADAVPHLTGAYLMGLQGGEAAQAPAVREDIAQGEALFQEFADADIVVIGVAFYNFTVSSQLKAWIDRILVPGKAFRYGLEGRPEGLMGGRRVILAIARGGFYGAGAPAEAFEHAETYLRAMLAFVGIPDPEVVVAEGLRAGPELREAGLAAANERIATLAA